MEHTWRGVIQLHRPPDPFAKSPLRGGKPVPPVETENLPIQAHTRELASVYCGPKLVLSAVEPRQDGCECIPINEAFHVVLPLLGPAAGPAEHIGQPLDDCAGFLPPDVGLEGKGRQGDLDNPHQVFFRHGKLA